jgi:hypothetical protein
MSNPFEDVAWTWNAGPFGKERKLGEDKSEIKHRLARASVHEALIACGGWRDGGCFRMRVAM